MGSYERHQLLTTLSPTNTTPTSHLQDIIVLATPLVTRGIDMMVHRVVLFDYPKNATEFLHTCDRTGRYIANGTSSTPSTPKGEGMLVLYERNYLRVTHACCVCSDRLCNQRRDWPCTSHRPSPLPHRSTRRCVVRPPETINEVKSTLRCSSRDSDR